MKGKNKTMKRFLSVITILALILWTGGSVYAYLDEPPPKDKNTSEDDVVPGCSDTPDTSPPDTSPPDTSPPTPGCGQELEDGTLQVVCSNPPEDMKSARVMVFPAKFLVQKETKDPEEGKRLGIAPMEGSALIKDLADSPVPVVSKDDRDTPVTLDGGGHIVLVMIKNGLLKAQFGLTTVRVKGDTTLNLDFDKLNLVGENLEDFFQKFSDKNAETEDE